MVVVIMAAAAVMTMVMMVIVATAIAVIVVVVMVMAVCDRCPAVFVKYHTYFIYDENLLFFGRSLVDGFHQEIHHIMDRIDGRQGACQVLHCQFSCPGGQSIEMLSCF